VRSTIAAGRVSRIDADAARGAPGVLAVITQENAPRLERGPASILGLQPPAPLQSDRIHHHGQYVESTPAEAGGVARAGPFAAKFVEVRVDAQLGVVRVARVVSVVDGGRILNEKLARSRLRRRS